MGERLQLIQELLEDADVFGYIHSGGAYPDVYDQHAVLIEESLSPDLSVSQISRIIWNAFYDQLCVCTIGDTDEPFVVSKRQAVYLIGDAGRFKALAKDIRKLVKY
jgi:hypothetical protein